MQARQLLSPKTSSKEKTVPLCVFAPYRQILFSLEFSTRLDCLFRSSGSVPSALFAATFLVQINM